MQEYDSPLFYFPFPKVATNLLLDPEIKKTADFNISLDVGKR